MVLSPLPRQDDGRCGGEWFFRSKSPHFISILIDQDTPNDNLRIPKKFVRNHGAALSTSWVFLEVPSGSIWEVKLHRDEDGLLLRDGWAEFVKHYEIRHGHLMVFRYEGGSKFSVVVFDGSAYEIDYRIVPDQDQRKADVLFPRPEKKPNVVEGTPNVRSRKRKAEQPPSQRPKKLRVPGKKRREESLVHTRGISGTRRSNLWSQASAQVPDNMNTAGESEGHLDACDVIQSEAVKAAKRSGALARATSFKCKGLPFRVVVHDSMVHPLFILHLPTKFVHKFASKLGSSGEMRFRVSGNKIWRFTYVKGVRYRINKGWKEFAKGNDLEVGDVCLFDFLMAEDGIGFAFDVTIFRSKRDPSCAK